MPNPALTSLIRSWWPEGADAALAIQPGTVGSSMNVVKDGGLVITVSGDDKVRPERSITIRKMQQDPETQHKVVALVSSIAKGKIRLVIEEVYPFDETQDALLKTETRHARGKIVVSLE